MRATGQKDSSYRSGVEEERTNDDDRKRNGKRYRLARQNNNAMNSRHLVVDDFICPKGRILDTPCRKHLSKFACTWYRTGKYGDFK
jgi:hypothetical protein